MGQRDEEIAGSSIGEPVSRIKALMRNTQQVQPNILYLPQKGRQVANMDHKTSKKNT